MCFDIDLLLCIGTSVRSDAVASQPSSTPFTTDLDSIAPIFRLYTICICHKTCRRSGEDEKSIGTTYSRRYARDHCPVRVRI